MIHGRRETDPYKQCELRGWMRENLTEAQFRKITRLSKGCRFLEDVREEFVQGPLFTFRYALAVIDSEWVYVSYDGSVFDSEELEEMRSITENTHSIGNVCFPKHGIHAVFKTEIRK